VEAVNQSGSLERLLIKDWVKKFKDTDVMNVGVRSIKV
jgi:hypothetical protein